MHSSVQRGVLLIAAFAGLAAVQGPPSDTVVRVTQAEFKKLFDAKQVVVIDARGGNAYKECHITGAIELPLDNPTKPSPGFDQAVAKVKAAKKTVITYCACPRDEDAVRVASVLAERGVADVRALRGGWNDWFNDGNPVTCRGR